jgi:adenylate cyclase
MSETRKLVAIPVADVVGYSRLAGADEERTLARLRGLRSDLIDPTIAARHGRIVKRARDGSIIAESSKRCAASSKCKGHGRAQFRSTSIPASQQRRIVKCGVPGFSFGKWRFPRCGHDRLADSGRTGTSV